MRRTHGEGSGHERSCFGCKVLTLQLSPAAVPSRKNDIPPKISDGANSWERGVVRDERNMPLLHPGSLEPVGLKEYVNNKGMFREAEGRLAHHRRTNTTH